MTDEPSCTMACRTGPTVSASVATNATAAAASAGRSQPILLNAGAESAWRGACVPPSEEDTREIQPRTVGPTRSTTGLPRDQATDQALARTGSPRTVSH
jgi:hypothetical protein